MPEEGDPATLPFTGLQLALMAMRRHRRILTGGLVLRARRAR